MQFFENLFTQSETRTRGLLHASETNYHLSCPEYGVSQIGPVTYKWLSMYFSRRLWIVFFSLHFIRSKSLRIEQPLFVLHVSISDRPRLLKDDDYEKEQIIYLYQHANYFTFIPACVSYDCYSACNMHFQIYFLRYMPYSVLVPRKTKSYAEREIPTLFRAVLNSPYAKLRSYGQVFCEAT